MWLPQQPISPWMFKWVPQPLRWHSQASTAPNQSLRLGTIRPTMVGPVPPVYCRWIQPLFLKGTTSNQTYLHSQAGPWPRVSRWYFITPEHHRGACTPCVQRSLLPEKECAALFFQRFPPPDPTLRVVSIPPLQLFELFQSQIQLSELFFTASQPSFCPVRSKPNCIYWANKAVRWNYMSMVHPVRSYCFWMNRWYPPILMVWMIPNRVSQTPGFPRWCTLNNFVSFQCWMLG